MMGELPAAASTNPSAREPDRKLDSASKSKKEKHEIDKEGAWTWESWR